MKSKRTYAVVGVGAVGGLYGSRLQRAGFEVHYLFHRDYAHARRHGLKVESPDGDFHLKKINAWNQARSMPPCDVVLVALKATSNGCLKDILQHVVCPKGTVILLQNGFGAEQDLARLLPGRTILGGLSFLCANKIGPGHIRHLDYGLICMARYRPGSRPGGITPLMEAIAADFQSSGTPVELSDDLVLARWKKLVWNVPFNGLSVVLNATTQGMMLQRPLRKLILELMEEVARGAAALGRTIPDAFVKKMLRDTVRMTPYQTSMKLDYDHGRPLEFEAIYGEPLKAVRRKGVHLPRMEMLYHLLQFLSENNHARRPKSSKRGS